MGKRKQVSVGEEGDRAGGGAAGGSLKEGGGTTAVSSRTRGTNPLTPTGAGSSAAQVSLDNIEDESEDACAYCNMGGVLVICEVPRCGRVYHASCMGREPPPDGTPFLCPVHFCCVCMQPDKLIRHDADVALFQCASCPSSFCPTHRPPSDKYRRASSAAAPVSLPEDAIFNELSKAGAAAPAVSGSGAEQAGAGAAAAAAKAGGNGSGGDAAGRPAKLARGNSDVDVSSSGRGAGSAAAAAAASAGGAAGGDPNGNRKRRRGADEEVMESTGDAVVSFGGASASSGRDGGGDGVFRCGNCTANTPRVQLARALENVIAQVVSGNKHSHAAIALLAPVTDPAALPVYLACGHTPASLGLTAADGAELLGSAGHTVESLLQGSSGSSSGEGGEGSESSAPSGLPASGSSSVPKKGTIARNPALKALVRFASLSDPAHVQKVLATGSEKEALPAPPSTLSDLLAAVRALKYSTVAEFVTDLWRMADIMTAISGGSRSNLATAFDPEPARLWAALDGDDPGPGVVSGSSGADLTASLDPLSGDLRLATGLLPPTPHRFGGVPRDSASAIASPLAAAAAGLLTPAGDNGPRFDVSSIVPLRLGFNTHDSNSIEVRNNGDVVSGSYTTGISSYAEAAKSVAVAIRRACESRKNRDKLRGLEKRVAAAAVHAAAAAITQAAQPATPSDGASAPAPADTPAGAPAAAAAPAATPAAAAAPSPAATSPAPQLSPEQVQREREVPGLFVVDVCAALGMNERAGLATLQRARYGCLRPELSWTHQPYALERKSLAEWHTHLEKAPIYAKANAKEILAEVLQRAVAGAAANKVLRGTGPGSSRWETGDAVAYATMINAQEALRGPAGDEDEDEEEGGGAATAAAASGGPAKRGPRVPKAPSTKASFMARSKLESLVPLSAPKAPVNDPAKKGTDYDRAVARWLKGTMQEVLLAAAEGEDVPAAELEAARTASTWGQLHLATLRQAAAATAAASSSSSSSNSSSGGSVALALGSLGAAGGPPADSPWKGLASGGAVGGVGLASASGGNIMDAFSAAAALPAVAVPVASSAESAAWEALLRSSLASSPAEAPAAPSGEGSQALSTLLLEAVRGSLAPAVPAPDAMKDDVEVFQVAPPASSSVLLQLLVSQQLALQQQAASLNVLQGSVRSLAQLVAVQQQQTVTLVTAAVKKAVASAPVVAAGPAGRVSTLPGPDNASRGTYSSYSALGRDAAAGNSSSSSSSSSSAAMLDVNWNDIDGDLGASLGTSSVLRQSLLGMSAQERESVAVLGEMAPVDVDADVGNVRDLLPPSQSEVLGLLDRLGTHLRRALITNAELRSGWVASRRACMSIPAPYGVEAVYQVPAEAAAAAGAGGAGEEEARGRWAPVYDDEPAALDAVNGGGIITIGDGRAMLEYETANAALHARVRALEAQLYAAQSLGKR